MFMPSTMPISKTALDKVQFQLGQERVQVDAPLKNLSWMKVGGNADLLFTAKNTTDLIDAVTAAKNHHIPIFILGGGSNIIISDQGIRGLVVKNRADKISLESVKGDVKQGKTGITDIRIKAESGVIINQFVRYCVDESLEGLEEFLGVPGTVGGAVYNNSHHLDHLIGDYVHKVEVITPELEIKTYSKDQLKFAYDYSILQKTGDIILSATFNVSPGDKKILWQRAESALKRRRDSQPLEKPSSGCMFKNLKESDAIAHHTPNHTKSAGQLIELSGLKGQSIGGAQVSQVHANFIVNDGTASAEDVKALADLVAKTVHERFGVTLEREVFYIGE